MLRATYHHAVKHLGLAIAGHFCLTSDKFYTAFCNNLLSLILTEGNMIFAQTADT
jgi:hypothetical protein